MKEQALDYIFDCVRKAHEAKDYEEFRRATDAYLALVGVSPVQSNPANIPPLPSTQEGNNI